MRRARRRRGGCEGRRAGRRRRRRRIVLLHASGLSALPLVHLQHVDTVQIRQIPLILIRNLNDALPHALVRICTKAIVSQNEKQSQERSERTRFSLRPSPPPRVPMLPDPPHPRPLPRLEPTRLSYRRPQLSTHHSRLEPLDPVEEPRPIRRRVLRCCGRFRETLRRTTTGGRQGPRKDGKRSALLALQCSVSSDRLAVVAEWTGVQSVGGVKAVEASTGGPEVVEIASGSGLGGRRRRWWGGGAPLAEDMEGRGGIDVGVRGG